MVKTTVPVNTSTDPAAPDIQVDRIGDADYQLIKIAFGIEDVADDVTPDQGLPVELVNTDPIEVSITAPVAISGTVPVTISAPIDVNEPVSVDGAVSVTNSPIIGAVTETAPASDTASSGLNGRLQRIAQRITSLIALFPTSLTAAGAFKTGPIESELSVALANGATVSAVIDRAGLNKLGVLLAAGLTGTLMGFNFVRFPGDGQYPVRDILGNPVQVPVSAGGYYDIPGELDSFRYFHITFNVAQSGAYTMYVWGRS